MGFKQKHVIDKDKLEKSLLEIFSEKITIVKIRFNDSGSTGGVFYLELKTEDKLKKFILKKVDRDDPYYRFYEAVLATYSLNHPKIISLLDIQEESFILMDFLSTSTTDWKEENYIHAVEWLAKKDQIINKNLGSIKKLSYLKDSTEYMNELKTEREDIFLNLSLEEAQLFRKLKPDKLLSI